MLTSAKKTMPALDYVSIIRSVYGDRRAMLAGAFASALSAALTAYRSQSLALYAIAVAFVVLGIIRYFNMRAFWRAGIGQTDAHTARNWEDRAVWTGSALALAYGLWCLFAMTLVDDPFAELASISLSIAVMVGICARNFGLDRLVTLQMLGVIVPMGLGFFLSGDPYHAVLAVLLLVMLASFRKLAGDIRSILLSAVHGRVEASRLAAELDLAITTLEHGLCMLDENGTVTLANERAVRTMALINIHALIGKPFDAVLSDLAATGRIPQTAIDRLGTMVGENQSGKVLLALGPGLYYEVTVSARGTRIVLLFEDISERVKAEERISFMARHDTLTGLPNRNYFGELALDELAERASRAQPSLLMIIDIDEFKHVNDSYGHVVGDELLRQVATRLQNALPANAVLARLGGDEFVALIGQGQEADTFMASADMVQAAFADPFLLKGITLPVRVSTGIVVSALTTDTLEDLMTKADLALYAAKGDGKARNEVFHAQMDIDYHYRQRLKADLTDAVAQGQISLAFQPLVDIRTRKVVSCEALARWTHPDLGPISPATFIPLAEEMGMVSDITAWVVRNAVRECSQWTGDVGVGINVSARDFRGLDLSRLINAALDEFDLPPQRLEIEVTETAVIEEPQLAKRVLGGLNHQGISIALDDFGTGYSSLSYLNDLPFNKLKIDRSFVIDVGSQAKALRLLASVARLGRDLDLTVVAEGVETEEQLQVMLEHTHVQQVQGYLFSRPLPARDIAELIARLNAPLPRQRLARKYSHS
ncbi:MAG: EAL domain-containing protein [Devosia sp.]|uniref:putative bifunctional diguanylate cyclase/phosphodiesterase n=1 Tax=Devosia sp. TaxID=1871048 RepID=UPI0024CC9D45|nr:EAL domain-containing protein [Devosia sp.]UYN98699.1 MAG: EAL domain-containing protein [Devosia sp.]